jgi:hypothetical protein
MNRMRSLLISLLLLGVAISAGVATASMLLSNEAKPAIDSAAVPGSQSAEARSDDPRGGLPFGVMVWHNEAGQTCAGLGRRVGDRITDPTGTRDYPVGDGGGCVDLVSLSGDLDLRQTGEYRSDDGLRLDPVTVIWGLAKPGITEVQVHAGRGVQVVRVTRGHAFVTTFPGAITTGVDVVAVNDNGVRRTTTFPGMPPEIRDRVLHPRTAEQIRLEMRQQEERLAAGAKSDARP